MQDHTLRNGYDYRPPRSRSRRRLLTLSPEATDALVRAACGAIQAAVITFTFGGLCLLLMRLTA